jgi:hypothetical protein
MIPWPQDRDGQQTPKVRSRLIRQKAENEKKYRKNWTCKGRLNHLVTKWKWPLYFKCNVKSIKELKS